MEDALIKSHIKLYIQICKIWHITNILIEFEFNINTRFVLSFYNIEIDGCQIKKNVIKSRSYVAINASFAENYQHNARSKFYLNILTLIKRTSTIKEKKKEKEKKGSWMITTVVRIMLQLKLN